ncbi:MAG: MGMT family protein [Candidatus Yanofskybacteria bacterium]|nr:MGMT family protein [Candidatus Yanofskybacteria bacterium]
MNKSILSTITRAALTDFQKAVYCATALIPKGETRTYAQIAAMIGRPRAARAVGNALNKNPFAPAVPCHRVIRSSGALGGFALGSATKKRLLKQEGAL